MIPELIETSGQMDGLLERLEGVTLIAVDTEFFRETTYFPRIALVQIGTDSIVACIDPLAFDARPALKKLLLDDRITKIFHSCSQDLEVLFYYLGEAPGAIYDTQIANALLTEHHQVGYASLVESELGITLDKSQTRTNWLQRPLSKEQLQYAGDDVFYLYQLQHVLDEKLQNLGRKTWFDEDSGRMLTDDSNYQAATDNLWKRVKGANRLDRRSLAIVQAIAVWREDVARKKDRTRRKIMADDIIINLASNPPETAAAINRYIDQRCKFNAEERRQLFYAITSALQTPAHQWPDSRFNPLDNEQKKSLRKLQRMVNDRAEELGISPAVLSSRKELENLIILHEQHDESRLQALGITQGWRRQCIGLQLLDSLK